MTNTIDPISYKAGIEAAAKMVERLFSGKTTYVGAELAARIRSLHRTEPQTAPADAERLALAEKIERARLGWLPIYGDVASVTLLLRERDLIVSSLRAGGWRGETTKEPPPPAPTDHTLTGRR